MSAPVRGHWADRYALRVEQERVLVDVVLDTGNTWPRSADSQLLDMATYYEGLRGIPLMVYGGLGAAQIGSRPGDGLR